MNNDAVMAELNGMLAPSPGLPPRPNPDNLNNFSTLLHQHNAKKAWLLIVTPERETPDTNAEFIDESLNGDQHFRINKLVTVSEDELKGHKSFMGRTVRNRIVSSDEILKAFGIGGKVYSSSEFDKLGNNPSDVALDALLYLGFKITEKDIASVVKQTIGIYKVKFEPSNGCFKGSLVLDLNFEDPLMASLPYHSDVL